MKRTSFLGTTLCAAFVPAAVPLAAASAQPHALTRDAVRRVIAANRKIVSPNGIEELLSVRIHGCTQWLSIRGRDRRNPVLLYLHGGPGSPTMPESWTFQKPWEDYFTVVQWDQRGAGKTYASNDPAAIAPTMTGEQLIADTVAVVRYLLEKLDRRKLILLGHSWGSYLGLEVARRHPELLYAYVGTGQMIDTHRSEELGYQFALDQARAHGNLPAKRELQALAPYPGPLGSLTVERIGVQRKWLVYYGGLTYGRTSFDYDGDAWQFAPEYTDEDVRLADKGSLFSLGHLLGVVERTNFTSLAQLECPLFIFQGDYDYETSYPVVRTWFSSLRAPHKGFVTFANASHMAMLEQPGLYLSQLASQVLPTAL